MSTYEILVEKGRMEERARLEVLLQAERDKAEAEKRRIALQLRDLGVRIADIAKGTGLSEEEIRKLN